jgi:hypothetical protein
MSALTPQMVATLQASDKDNKTKAYIAGNAICLVAAFIAVVLRFASRRVARAKIGIDDYLIVIALVEELLTC